MADDAKADDEDLVAPWDEQTDSFVVELEPIIKQKYSVSIRQLLLSPDDFAKNKAVITAMPDIKKSVSSYFDDVLVGFKDDKAKLDKDLQTIDSQFKKIDDIITSKSSIAKVPYIKPIVVDYDQNRQEEIIIDQYNPNVDALVNKLLNVSIYVANMSTTYKGYNMGTWIFSGQREYILTLNPPISPVITIESSRDLLNTILDEVQKRLTSA